MIERGLKQIPSTSASELEGLDWKFMESAACDSLRDVKEQRNATCTGQVMCSCVSEWTANAADEPDTPKIQAGNKLELHMPSPPGLAAHSLALGQSPARAPSRTSSPLASPGLILSLLELFAHGHVYISVLSIMETVFIPASLIVSISIASIQAC